MQNDFHYCCIKALAFSAGFKEQEAQVIAYASQYVDDAVEHIPFRVENLTNDTVKGIRVKNEMFDPICTAHKGFQFLAAPNKDAQRKVYIPFHFLPAHPYKGEGSFDYRVQSNTPFAKSLLEAAKTTVRKAKQKDLRERALIQLGIILHTFADTWSHQMFSGRWSAEDNDIERIRIWEDGEYEKINFAQQAIYNLIPSIGHAEAVNLPDQTQLKWIYEHDHSGIDRERNNTGMFLEAAYEIYSHLVEVSPSDHEPKSWKAISEKVHECLAVQTDKVKEKWPEWIHAFPETQFEYKDTCWREEALDGDSFNWTNYDEEDYSQADYRLKGDRKFFHFHALAGKQRSEVLKKIRVDLK